MLPARAVNSNLNSKNVPGPGLQRVGPWEVAAEAPSNLVVDGTHGDRNATNGGSGFFGLGKVGEVILGIWDYLFEFGNLDDFWSILGIHGTSHADMWALKRAGFM